MKRLGLFLAALVLCVNAFAQSQNATLNGTVYDPANQPLVGASVTLESAQTGVHETLMTGSDGTFSFTVPSGDDYVITAERYGQLLDQQAGISLAAGEQRELLPPLKEKLVAHAPPRIHLTLADIQDHLLNKVQPAYPTAAMKCGVQGPVTLEMLIAPDGAVHGVVALTGDAMLRQSAMNAVKQWRFKPFYTGDRAAEVETQITLIFHLTVIPPLRAKAEDTTTPPAAPLPSTPGDTGISARAPEPAEAGPHVDMAMRSALAPVSPDPEVALLARIDKLTADDLPKLVHDSVENGNPESQYILGAAFELGRGAPQDLEQAVQWYRKSASQSYAPAEFALAEMTAAGRGTEKDATAAVTLYLSAAKQGDHLAQRAIGHIYHAGLLGVGQNVVEAHQWLEKAGAEESSMAASVGGNVTDPLGRPAAGAELVLENAAIGYARGEKARADGIYRFELVQPADGYVITAGRDGKVLASKDKLTIAADGHHEAEADLQLPVTPEFVRSLKDSADKGDTSSQYTLASWMIKGTNLPHDEQGWLWMRRAATAGNPAAQQALGLAYFSGDGLPREMENACFWLALSGPPDQEGKDALQKATARLTRAQLRTVKKRVETWKAEHPPTSLPPANQ